MWSKIAFASFRLRLSLPVKIFTSLFPPRLPGRVSGSALGEMS